MRVVAIALAGALLAAGCGGEEAAVEPTQTPTATATATAAEARFPTIEDVEVTETAPGVYDFAVTISSPYDSPERYANGWRVLTPGGDVLGEHELAHDHADEQPFTRTQSGVEIPGSVERVVVEPRDLANGYGGETVEVALPG